MDKTTKRKKDIGKSKMVLKILMIISVTVFSSCGFGNAETPQQAQEVIANIINTSILGTVDGDRIIIDKDVDLKGSVCKIPAGKTLVFKDGIIKNGNLHGNMTKIECKGKAFNRVIIKGSWDVPEISTKLFADLNYENSLRDVAALAHPKVKNRIIIEKGEYKVKAEQKAKVCVPLCSNTDFILKGTIRLEPNNFKHYYIIQAKGENINIKGNGTIIGDKHTHLGAEGEWGMGIDLKGAINTTVTGLTIKDCWGDCIYVGGNSRKVLIEKCKLDHGRRQGISVTKANGVTIRNCTITNVGGTAPEYAIDIEPNKRCNVDNVFIDGVLVKNCEGGILVTRSMSKKPENIGTRIGSVKIRNCVVTVNTKYPMRFKGCEKVSVKKCIIYAPGTKSAIYSTSVGEISVVGNTIALQNNTKLNFLNVISRLVGGEDLNPISVGKARKKEIKHNHTIKK